MKINPAALQQVLQSYEAAKADGANKGKGAAGAAPVRNDQITISPEALELQRLLQAANVTQDVRTQTVEDVRTSIRTGAYLLSPQAIANKMLGLGGA